MKKRSIFLIELSAVICLAGVTNAQLNIGVGGRRGVNVSIGAPPPPVVVAPPPVVVAPPPPAVVVPPAPVVVAPPPPPVVVPQYGYGWYGDYWVPSYNGWYYYNDSWCWGGRGPRPHHSPHWRPDYRRPAPPRPHRVDPRHDHRHNTRRYHR